MPIITLSRNTKWNRNFAEKLLFPNLWIRDNLKKLTRFFCSDGFCLSMSGTFLNWITLYLVVENHPWISCCTCSSGVYKSYGFEQCSTPTNILLFKETYNQNFCNGIYFSTYIIRYQVSNYVKWLKTTFLPLSNTWQVLIRNTCMHCTAQNDCDL